MSLPTTREMIGALVAERSSSSADPRFDLGNRRVVELVAGWARGLGFACELRESGEREDKVNLVATLGSGDGGLVLAGHADTVPWDEGKWRGDPFRVRDVDGALVGLGTADMKSFFALALAAVSRVDPKKLRHPIILLATYDEESTMAGARALVASRAVSAAHAIIGEPTLLRPVRMHKGALMEVLRLEGKSGHSSDPAHGRSALEGMQLVMTALLAFRDELQRTHRHDGFAVPVPTLNLGAIHGGDSPNRICAECELRFDLRALPGMDVAAARAELRARAEAAVAGRGLVVTWRSAHTGSSPFEVSATATVVRTVAELTGSEPMSVAFGTEAPYLAQLGMDVVVCGPGDIGRAHQPEESLDLAAIEPAVTLYHRAIERLCT